MARSFERAFELQPGPEGPRATLDGFGGTTLGCAALALAREARGLSLHALHVCFLRPVPSDRPVALRIETLSDGRRFARRRLEIREEGRLLFDAVASFAAPAEGPSFADEWAPELPAPEELPSDEEVADAEGWERNDDFERLLELRWCGRPWALDRPAASSRYDAWVRPLARPAGEASRAAGIAYTSDFHSHWPVARKLGGSFDTSGFTSLDQVLWIHRDDPWDDWWLLTSWTDQGYAGRALSHRTLRDRQGRLIASMAQEALIPGARLRST